MTEENENETADSLKKLFEGSESEQFVLRLYVTGSTPRSVDAIRNIRTICETYLRDKVELEIIDTYQKPERAREDQIIALPTLIKQLPPPIKRIIGDLSNTEKVLVGLDLIEKDQETNT